MLVNFARNNTIIWKATFILLTLGLLPLAAHAQTKGEATETIVTGQSILVGIVQGEKLRFTAFNPFETDAGQPNQSIRLDWHVYDTQGRVLYRLPDSVEIPPGEFRSVEVDRNDLPISGEPGTTRAQVRTVPLWGLRTRAHLHVSTTLEIVNSSSQAGTFKFFINVEALP